MKCPQCDSTQTAKNGHRRGRQCYKCKQCGRQFLESYRPWRYSDSGQANVHQNVFERDGAAWHPYESPRFTIPLSCIGFERLDINSLSSPESEEIPEITDLDELQTFVGSKRNKLWIGCAVNHKQAGILAWVIGDLSCSNLQALVAHRQMLALFLLCH